jgi:hypothetical protein
LPSGDSTLESLKDALGDVAGEAVTTWAAINTKHVEMGHGRYGHSTVKVAAVYLQDEDGAPEHKIIVKAFSSKSARDNEAIRHLAARRDAPEFAARHLVDLAFNPIACGDRGVVMVQELAKGGLQEHAPMPTLFGKASAGVAAGKIYDSLLTEWNATGTRPESTRGRTRTSEFTTCRSPCEFPAGTAIVIPRVSGPSRNRASGSTSPSRTVICLSVKD